MKSSELIRLVERAGWIEIRQKGSHKIFYNIDTGESVSVPYHSSREVPKGTAIKVLKKIGLK